MLQQLLHGEAVPQLHGVEQAFQAQLPADAQLFGVGAGARRLEASQNLPLVRGGEALGQVFGGHLVQAGGQHGAHAHRVAVEGVLLPPAQGVHLPVVGHLVLRPRGRPGDAHHAHGQAGEDERLCHSLDGLGLPLGQRLGVGRASLHSCLDDARHLGAVVFPVELVGQPPVRQGGELPDDVPKAGGEHGHGGIL